MSHNFFVQLVGSKKFTVVPAHLVEDMMPYTDRMHVHPPAAVQEFVKRKGLTVTLNPGDALYIPPMMFHEVQALSTHTISVNVWSKSVEDEAQKVVSFDTLLPFDEAWNKMEGIREYASMRYAHALLCGNYDGCQNALDWYKRRWRGRYPLDLSTRERWHLTHLTASTSTLIDQKQQGRFLMRALEVRVDVEKRVRTSETNMIAILWNYVDEVVTTGCDPRNNQESIIGCIAGYTKLTLHLS